MFWRYNTVTLLWALFILFLTLTPGQYMPETDFWSFISFDKAAHIFVFGVLCFLMILGFVKQLTYPRLKEKAIIFSIIISAGYGFLIEVFQTLVPGRSFELYDTLADLIGALIGYAVFNFIQRRYNLTK